MKIKDIEALTQRWLSAGAISPEQADYFVADVKNYIADKSGVKFISAIMYMGATALSLGALLFIASNWEYMGDGFKVILSFLLPLIPLIFAYWHMFIKQADTVLAKAAHILGLVLVGGSIALIEQIYNLQSDTQAVLWIWNLLTIPFIFVFKKPENIVFTTLLTGSAILFSLFDFFDKSRIDENVGIVLITSVTLLYAYLMYAIGGALRNVSLWEQGGRLLRIGGGIIASIMLFLMTFEWYARMVVSNNSHDYYRNYADPISWQPLSIVLNLVFLGFLVFALFRATKYEEYQFAFSVVRLFGLYLLVKYFTLFYGMFETSLFFIVGGILFIAGGWFLEKNKNVLVQYMKSSGQSGINNGSQQNYGQ